MLLKKLYSESGIIEPIPFRPGINIIQGVYTKSESERSELNGIGKSTAVRLVDFALASDSGKKHYFNTKFTELEFLKGHSVTLEFEDEGKSFYVKRYFSDPSEIHFGEDNANLKPYPESEIKLILGNLFFGRSKYNGCYENKWFRELIHFFIKDDQTNRNRTNPFKFADTHNTKFEDYKLNLFLLDLPNTNTVKFDKLAKEKRNLNSQRKETIKQVQEETGKKIEEIKSEIEIIESKIQAIQQSLDKYQFLESYKNIEDDLIHLSGDISELVRKSNYLRRRLSEYKKSYEYEIEIDQQQISKIYSGIKTVFGDIVKRELSEVISFRKKLAENRQTFLVEKEIQITNELKGIEKSIGALEEKRSNYLKLLDEKKALDSVKNSYVLLSEQKANKERMLNKITSISKIEQKIFENNEEIGKTVKEINQELREVDNRIKNITKIFLKIAEVTNPEDETRGAYFDISPQTKLNSPLTIKLKIPKSDSLGRKWFELLAYDLTVFLSVINSNRKLPHFLFHDGIHQTIGPKTLVKTLNYINSMFNQKGNFQYILTANENELFIPDEKKHMYGDFNFEIQDCIIKTYKDVPKEMIFKQEYDIPAKVR